MMVCSDKTMMASWKWHAVVILHARSARGRAEYTHTTVLANIIADRSIDRSILTISFFPRIQERATKRCRLCWCGAPSERKKDKASKLLSK